MSELAIVELALSPDRFLSTIQIGITFVAILAGALVGATMCATVGLSWNANMDHTTVLFRPVGQKELELIRASGFTEFPPRLPEQPIFYPVLNEEYAVQIARDWNAKRGEKVGYVTRFHVRTEHLQRYQIQTVGGSMHQEYWIPAEELAEFNKNLVGTIEVIAEYRGTMQ